MIGQWFGNYRAISLLGEGGMGAVYLAEHPAIGRRVAVKVLHRNLSLDPQLLGRFLNEARTANAIRHPNIIEILDSGALSDGMPYLVMELLEGESLAARIARLGRLPTKSALRFAGAVLGTPLYMSGGRGRYPGRQRQRRSAAGQLSVSQSSLHL